MDSQRSSCFPISIRKGTQRGFFIFPSTLIALLRISKFLSFLITSIRCSMEELSGISPRASTAIRRISGSLSFNLENKIFRASLLPIFPRASTTFRSSSPSPLLRSSIRDTKALLSPILPRASTTLTLTLRLSNFNAFIRGSTAAILPIIPRAWAALQARSHSLETLSKASISRGNALSPSLISSPKLLLAK
ncbi:MAG: hypothetical protein BWY64_03748 [bacterium ADurb.Bin363]|nr:MAG: hypothetical protein BWY64_03748 [bacterium ADurb.Bin363]